MCKEEYVVLDKGFIKLIDMMGSDKAIVQAARVSHGEGTKTEEKDRRLINHLMKNRHLSPFEQAAFKYHVKCPIFVARQWFRHRWASYNEISGRYTKFEDEFYLPDTLRKSTGKSKSEQKYTQSEHRKLKNILQEAYNYAYNTYKELLEEGVTKEQARMILPFSFYTQFYTTIPVRSLFNFINQRADSHAQYEIRVYAEKMAQMLKDRMPWTWKAFLKYYWSGENDLITNLE